MSPRKTAKRGNNSETQNEELLSPEMTEHAEVQAKEVAESPVTEADAMAEAPAELQIPEAQPAEEVNEEEEAGGVKGFFRNIGNKIKNWFNEKIVAKFKAIQEKWKNRKYRTFKQWIVAVGVWFKTLPSRTVKWFKSLTKEGVKAFFLGTGEKKGFLQCFVSYALLILFGFVYIYPILYMLGYSLMSPSDVSNPMVNYLPTQMYFNNYSEAAQVLDYFPTLLQTLYVAVLPSIVQTVACCVVSYGLARFNFPGKKVLFAFILLTFIIPPQLTMMPQVLLYTNLKIIDTLFSYIIPALFGQGIKSAVFILIFYQFFKGIPDSVVEAAKIDGANSLQIFLKIGIPAAVPAILLSFLLSMVWYYNETVLTAIYVGGVNTLPLQLEKFQEQYNSIFGGSASASGKTVNEAIYMAGTLLSILPLLIIYFFTQRHFTEGIDKAGITGE